MAPIPVKTKPNLGSVLVTGGCGFLGHHIVKLLLERYSTSQISVVDLRTTASRRPDSDGVKYFECDITNSPALLQVFEQVKPTVVIHTASPNGNDYVSSRKLFYRVNVEGTKALIEACQKLAVTALIYTSSASVLSDSKADLINADERWPVLRGKSQPEYYSATKAMAEDLVLAANRVAPHLLLTCSLRPAGLFGEGDPQMVPALLDVYYNKKHHFQLGSNDNLFDFTYVGNVAHAHLLAAEALVATSTFSTAPLDHEKVDGEAFLITNGTPICFWDLPRMLWREVGADLPIEKVWTISKDIGIPLAAIVESICMLIGVTTKFTRKGFRMSSMVRYYNIDKARSRLGYEPLWSIPEGVKLSAQWDTEERIKKGEKKDQ